MDKESNKFDEFEEALETIKKGWKIYITSFYSRNKS